MTRVVLSQPRPRVDRLAQRLQADGHQCACLSVRRLQSLVVEQPEVSATFERLADWDWVVFVSPGAIEIAFQSIGNRWPQHTGIALVGPGSLAELRGQGIDPSAQPLLMPEQAPYDADALIALPPFDAPKGLKILVLAGDLGRQDWIETLAGRGALVRRLVLYRSLACEPAAGQLAQVMQWAKAKDPVVFSFTTRDAVDSIDELLDGHGISAWARAQQAFAPHARIVLHLRELGWRRACLLEPGDQALLAAIESDGNPGKVLND